jgi:hypothetical protein
MGREKYFSKITLKHFNIKAMPLLTPKQFIQNVLIEEMKDMVFRHPFLAFSLISQGVEFLGKCLNEEKDWHTQPKNVKDFELGKMLLVNIDERYKHVNLRDELRNGFAHSLSPKNKIALSEVKSGNKHFSLNKDGKIILVIEIFYRDFVEACQKIIRTEFSEENKVNKPFLDIS